MQKATLATFGITYERVDFTPILCLCARLRGATRRNGSSHVPRKELAEHKIVIGCEPRHGSERPARGAAPPFAVAVSALGSSGRGVQAAPAGLRCPSGTEPAAPPAAVLLALARNGGSESNSFYPLLPPRHSALPSLLIIAGQLLICM